MYFYSCSVAIGTKGRIHLHDTDVETLYSRKLGKEALPYSSCHMFQQLAGHSHLLFQQGVDVGIVHRVLQLIGLQGMGEIAVCHDVHHIVIAHAALLFQHSMIGMKPDIAQEDAAVLYLHAHPPSPTVGSPRIHTSSAHAPRPPSKC